jgi:hypothetical protein
MWMPCGSLREGGDRDADLGQFGEPDAEVDFGSGAVVPKLQVR